MRLLRARLASFEVAHILLARRESEGFPSFFPLRTQELPKAETTSLTRRAVVLVDLTVYAINNDSAEALLHS